MSLTEFTRFLVAFLVICAVAKSFDPVCAPPD
jgi:hypothetical protein